MNKTEVINTVAQQTGHSAQVVGDVLGSFESVVVAGVKSGEKVTLPGFLSFDRTERAARTGRNPQTGAVLQIAAATVPRVKVGKTFKDAVGS